MNSTTMCSGVSATLTATGGANAYTFAPAGGIQTGNVYVVSPNATTVYSVTGVTGNCSRVASATVIVFPKPTVGANQTLVCANGVVPGSTTLTAQTNSSVLTGQWYVQPGNPSATTFANATSLTTTVSGLLPGQSYTFVWANTSGCADGLTITVGTCATVAPASLGDFVWFDTNGNGQQEGTETGVPGVVVRLYTPLSSTTTPVASLTTGSDGKYLFTNLTPGVYCVIFDKTTLPVGYTLTTPNSGTDATDSDADLVTGKTTNYTLAAGDQNLTVDAGIKPLPASLGDKVFADNNRNGIQDTGDTPISGVIVTLISNGTLVATTTTLSSGTGIGCYSFTGLTPGVPYSVSFTTPAGYSVTTPLSGTDRTKDSDPVGGITAPVTLTAGENNPTIDAGYTPLLGSLGNFVWKDNNNNGKQDPNEPGVADIVVQLFTVVANVTSTTPLATTITNASGQYAFTGLPQGDYRVKFTLPDSQTGACQITPIKDAGADDTIDSDIDPLTGFSPVITINPSGTGVAVNNPTVDLGLQRKIYDPVGYIYCYANNTILKGGTIHVTGPGSISVIKNGLDGSYQFFTDGTPGSYTLSYSHPNGYSIASVQRPVAASHIDPTGLEGTSADKDGLLNGWLSLGSLPNSTTNPASLVNGSAAANPYYLVFDVRAGDPYVSENNLPVDYTDPLGSIGSRVWKDLNQNGQYDSGSEVGVDGVTVRLLQVTSPVGSTVISTTLVSTTVTAGAGLYEFTGLPQGRYIVEFDKTTLPADCQLSPQNNAPGVPDTLDSDADPTTGRSPIIDLVPGDPARTIILSIDAGLVTTPCPTAPRCVPISIGKIVNAGGR